MTLAIESTRFGRVEVDPENVIAFPDGLIGLGATQFTLLAREAGSPLLWLHGVDEPSLALPVANPHDFFADFSVELTDDDAERCALDETTPVDVYVTVRTASEVTEFTANLKAPILIWAGRGYQVINQAPRCDLRAPLFAEVLAAAPPPSADSAPTS